MILSIESSCDETGAAVVRKNGEGVEVVASVKASSEKLQIKYGGIVPEVAAREQIKVILPVIERVMNKAGGGKEEIESVAVTVGPGLMGSLLIGVETSKALSWGWGKKLLAVNHMKAHVLANWIKQENGWKPPTLPALALVVSGGHTDLVLIKSLDEWEKVGGTRDDAAGECFDKAARALGLSYPGGPEIEKQADKVSESRFKLPRPLIHDDSLEMSFSGLKTAVVRKVEEVGKMSDKLRAELAWEVNEAIVDVLVEKTRRAVVKFTPESILLAGGVAANKRLRSKLGKLAAEWGLDFRMPDFEYCTDNAAMIGAAAVMRGVKADQLRLRPQVNLGTADQV